MRSDTRPRDVSPNFSRAAGGCTENTGRSVLPTSHRYRYRVGGQSVFLAAAIDRQEVRQKCGPFHCPSMLPSSIHIMALHTGRADGAGEHGRGAKQRARVSPIRRVAASPLRALASLRALLAGGCWATRGRRWRRWVSFVRSPSSPPLPPPAVMSPSRSSSSISTAPSPCPSSRAWP